MKSTNLIKTQSIVKNRKYEYFERQTMTKDKTKKRIAKCNDKKTLKKKFADDSLSDFYYFIF